MCKEKSKPKTKEEAMSQVRENQTVNGFPKLRDSKIEIPSDENNRFSNLKDNRNKSRIERGKANER